MAGEGALHVTDGSPEPLGVSLTKDGINVAVHSDHATHIEFCLFDADGQVEIALSLIHI